MVDPNAARQAQAAQAEALSKPFVSTQSNKPFFNYSPTSSISPYLGMYTPQRSQVDSYINQVRPELQQDSANEHFGGQIRGLQSAAQRQGSTVQRLGKRAQTQEGVLVAPEYFMNSRVFFPAFQ